MTVGIVGAGQLGRMLALAGYPLGLDFLCLDPARKAPAKRTASRSEPAMVEAARRRMLARHRTSYPRPVVELLFGRAALPRPFGSCTVQQVGGEAGHPVSGFRHGSSFL